MKRLTGPQFDNLISERTSPDIAAALRSCLVDGVPVVHAAKANNVSRVGIYQAYNRLLKDDTALARVGLTRVVVDVPTHKAAEFRIQAQMYLSWLAEQEVIANQAHRYLNDTESV